jgi:UrcA family protein
MFFAVFGRQPCDPPSYAQTRRSRIFWGRKEFVVRHSNFVSLCAAVVITGTGVMAPATPAFGKSPRIVVTAPSDHLTRRIGYGDLNLASAAGKTALRYRVRGGIRSLCTEVGGPYQSELENCTDGAWSQARPQMSLAVQRAHEIASTGSSTITAAAITISFSK